MLSATHQSSTTKVPPHEWGLVPTTSKRKSYQSTQWIFLQIGLLKCPCSHKQYCYFCYTLCILCAGSFSLPPEDQCPQTESSSLLAPPAASKSTPESLDSSQHVMCLDGAKSSAQIHNKPTWKGEALLSWLLDCPQPLARCSAKALQAHCDLVSCLHGTNPTSTRVAACIGCVLFWEQQANKITLVFTQQHACVCGERELSCLKQQSVLPPKASTSQQALVHSCIEACIHVTGLTRLYLDSQILPVCPALSGWGGTPKGQLMPLLHPSEALCASQSHCTSTSQSYWLFLFTASIKVVGIQ